MVRLEKGGPTRQDWVRPVCPGFVVPVLSRYYDFNVWSERKFVEKLRYIHHNPVKRGLVARLEDWPRSSFLHYATGQAGIVGIESQWTARHRERAGIFLTLKRRAAESPRSSEARTRHPRE